MKKVFSLMLLLATMLTFTACSGDDDEPENSLSGTTWTSSYVDEIFVFEFSGKNEVTGFMADENLNIKGKAYHGTYSRDGNNILFNDFYIMNYYKYVFSKAVISGTTMEVNYHWVYSFSGENSDETSRTFRKR